MSTCATFEEWFQSNGVPLVPLESLAIIETKLSQRSSWATHNGTKA